MLPFFPTPYPDELFYGICARYHQRSGHSSVGRSLEEMFGSRLAIVAIDLPTCIPSITEKLHPLTLHTAQHIINAHTMLPLYRPFLPKDRASRILMGMSGEAAHGNVHMTIGATASGIRQNRFLRYCPECIRADTAVYGELYWHRSHQVPGLRVCHLHLERLLDSTVIARGQSGRRELVQLSPEVLGQTTRTASGSTNHLAWLSKAAYWLLNTNPPQIVMGLADIRNLYLRHLNIHGLACESGRLRSTELLMRFSDYYGHEFLSDMQSALAPDGTDNWLLALLRKPRKATNPLRHLLVIRFLGSDVANFFVSRMDTGCRSRINQCASQEDTSDKNTPFPDDATCKTRRENWMRACAARPTAGVKEVRLVAGGDYAWLYRHDRNWLAAHTTPRKTRSTTGSRIDWTERDEALSSQVLDAAARIRKSIAPPMRVTARAIGRILSASAYLEKLQDNFPKTKAVLSTLLETREDFAFRRLYLAAEKLRRQSGSFREWELVRAAGLRPGYSAGIADEIRRLSIECPISAKELP